MDELLSSPLGHALMSYREEELFGLLMNDAYKPKMHKLYAQLYSGVEADFCLNIRRTPFPLRRMFEEVAPCLDPAFGARCSSSNLLTCMLGHPYSTAG